MTADDPTQVRRWSGHGHDRVYVRGVEPGGTGWADLGFVDLNTGTVHPDPGQDPDRVWDAVAHWAIRSRTPLPARRDAPTATVDTLPTTDLAARRAGQSAADTADAVAGRWRWGRRTRDARSWRVGAAGERKVGADLDRLRGWHVAHAVPVGVHGADVDHVLAGPGGVFAVNTKTHPGRTVQVDRSAVLIDGTRTDYAARAREERERVARALSRRAGGAEVPVHSLLVFVDVARLDVQGFPGLSAVTRADLRPWLTGRGTVLTPTQVDWLAGVIVDPATWRTR